MRPWWRSLVGILAGGAQAYAGGLNWKSVLAGLGVALLGVVSHLSSPGAPTITITRNPPASTGSSHRIA